MGLQDYPVQRSFLPLERGEPQLLSAVLVSYKLTHKQKKKAKISLKKSFLLASHTDTPEAGAEKAGCSGFPPLCPRCSSVSLLFPQADPAVAPAAEQPETSQPSATLSHLLPANVVHELPLPICALALGPGSSPSPSLQHRNHS